MNNRHNLHTDKQELIRPPKRPDELLHYHNQYNYQSVHIFSGSIPSEHYP